MPEHTNQHEMPEPRDAELEAMLAAGLGPHGDVVPPADLAQRIIDATAGRVTARRRPVLARLGGRRLWTAAAMAAACAVAVGLLWRLGVPWPATTTPTAIESRIVATAEDAWPAGLDQTLAAITAESVHAGIDAELALLDYDVDQLDQVAGDTSLADAAAALDELLRQWEHHADDEQVGLF